MKRNIIISTIILLGFVILTFSQGLGGSSDDPLVTKNEASDILSDEALDYVNQRLEDIEPTLETAVALSIADDVLTETKISYVQNDTLNLTTGDKVTLRSGTISLTGEGSLINVTDGTVVENPTMINYDKSYVVADNSNFEIVVQSLTSKIVTNVPFTQEYEIKYNSYAEALQFLGLFNGTDYGFELDRPATRTESLIMLIRILGEESDALAYEGTHPFSDVASWADKYVAYAYDKGYTNGLNATTFGADNIVKDYEYYTFLLRALSYKDGTDFNWDESTKKALELKIIEDDDYSVFFRDNIAYASFNTLDVNMKDSEDTLAEFLADKSIINLEDYSESKNIIK